MRLVKEELDSIFKFYRFQHYYKNILVEGSGYTLQFKKDNLELAFGSIADSLDIDVKNVVKPEIALDEAKKNTKDPKNAMDSSERKERKDSTETDLSKGELVITRTNAGEFKLTYKFDIATYFPVYDHSIYYIDAQTGKFIKEQKLFYPAISSGVTYYNGTQSFTTYYTSGHWRLEDRTRGIIHAKLNPANWVWDGSKWVLDWVSYPLLNDWDNNWDWLTERPAVSAQWAAEKCYDYFHIFGRNGTNNANRELRLSTKYPDFNAGFDTDLLNSWDDIIIGYINDTSLAALDIIGHEYTHGITYFTAGLAYVAEESGALNESFSDIFGECIEYYVNGSCNWLVGGEFFTLRSFINPNESHTRYGYDHGHQPDYYHEAGYWYYSNPNIDPNFNTGIYVHTNSGVQNRWFYLLVNGDPQLGVSGIGMAKAAKIAYRNLTSYLYNTPNANFNQAREGSVNAATYYYGECSFEYQQVMNAWAAVGVGNPAPNPCIIPLSVTINYPGEVLCNYCNLWTSTVIGGTGNYLYNWYLDGNWISNEPFLELCFSNWEIQYSTIELIVSSGTISDSDFTSFYIDCSGSYLLQKSGISLLIYPNPATNLATIEFSVDDNSSEDLKNMDYYIYLFDNSGRALFSETTRNDKIEINVGKYMKGTYSIIVTKGKLKGTSQLVIN